MVHFFAVFAEAERKKISQRTKAALAAKKARGETLGGTRESILKAAAASRRVRSAKSIEHANRVLPIIEDIRKVGGVTTLAGIAAALNARGVKTSRNGKWYASSVSRVLSKK